MKHVLTHSVFLFLLLGLTTTSFAQQPDQPSNQPPRDEPAPRREPRRDDEPPPPPPPKQKNKELFDRDFPGPRDGRPGGDKNGPPKGKAGPGDRRPGEESPLDLVRRKQSDAKIYMTMHDRNLDGVLDRSEWMHLKDAEIYDTDHDGVITLIELINAPRIVVGSMPIPNYGGGFSGGRGFGGGRPGAMPGLGGLMPGMPGAPPFGEQPPDDPEMRDLMREDAEMDRKVHSLAMRVSESRGEDRTKLKAELTEIVNKHFDVRQKRRELQLKRMEDELQRLREAISSRNKSRESIVTNHIKELVGEERDLEF